MKEVIIKGVFKDGKGIFYVCKEACKYDVFCRAVMRENATVFKEKEAKNFLKRLAKKCDRFNEVDFVLEELI